MKELMAVSTRRLVEGVDASPFGNADCSPEDRWIHLRSSAHSATLLRKVMELAEEARRVDEVPESEGNDLNLLSAGMTSYSSSSSSGSELGRMMERARVGAEQLRRMTLNGPSETTIGASTFWSDFLLPVGFNDATQLSESSLDDRKELLQPQDLERRIQGKAKKAKSSLPSISSSSSTTTIPSGSPDTPETTTFANVKSKSGTGGRRTSARTGGNEVKKATRGSNTKSTATAQDATVSPKSHEKSSNKSETYSKSSSPLPQSAGVDSSESSSTTVTTATTPTPTLVSASTANYIAPPVMTTLHRHLSKPDMRIFGLVPLEDERSLMSCPSCSKVLMESSYVRHVGICHRWTQERLNESTFYSASQKQPSYTSSKHPASSKTYNGTNSSSSLRIDGRANVKRENSSDNLFSSQSSKRTPQTIQHPTAGNKNPVTIKHELSGERIHVADLEKSALPSAGFGPHPSQTTPKPGSTTNAARKITIASSTRPPTPTGNTSANSASSTPPPMYGSMTGTFADPTRGYFTSSNPAAQGITPTRATTPTNPSPSAQGYSSVHSHQKSPTPPHTYTHPPILGSPRAGLKNTIGLSSSTIGLSSPSSSNPPYIANGTRNSISMPGGNSSGAGGTNLSGSSASPSPVPYHGMDLASPIPSSPSNKNGVGGVSPSLRQTGSGMPSNVSPPPSYTLQDASSQAGMRASGGQKRSYSRMSAVGSGGAENDQNIMDGTPLDSPSISMENPSYGGVNSNSSRGYMEQHHQFKMRQSTPIQDNGETHLWDSQSHAAATSPAGSTTNTRQASRTAHQASVGGQKLLQGSSQISNNSPPLSHFNPYQTSTPNSSSHASSTTSSRSPSPAPSASNMSLRSSRPSTAPVYSGPPYPTSSLQSSGTLSPPPTISLNRSGPSPAPLPLSTPPRRYGSQETSPTSSSSLISHSGSYPYMETMPDQSPRTRISLSSSVGAQQHETSPTLQAQHQQVMRHQAAQQAAQQQLNTYYHRTQCLSMPPAGGVSPSEYKELLQQVNQSRGFTMSDHQSVVFPHNRSTLGSSFPQTSPQPASQPAPTHATSTKPTKKA